MSDIIMSETSLHDIKHAPKLMALRQLLNDCGIGVISESKYLFLHQY